jgi:hypothetical protein
MNGSAVLLIFLAGGCAGYGLRHLIYVRRHLVAKQRRAYRYGVINSVFAAKRTF